MLKTATNRYFTEAAREAALLARRRRKELVVDRNHPEVFVVRSIEDERRFSWEIRRFGGVVLDFSRDHFNTIQDAQTAGQQALRIFVAQALTKPLSPTQPTPAISPLRPTPRSLTLEL